MDPKPLPAHPSLDQYRKQAKELVKQHKAGDADALRRIVAQHPRLRHLADRERREAPFRLADAQLVIAREHGFDSWPRFVRQLNALAGDVTPERLWQAAERALIAADDDALARLLREQPRFFREGRAPAYVPRGPYPVYDGDARAVILREQAFADWPALVAHLDARRQPETPVARFEAAVDAIITGDAATLQRLLREQPELVHARSTRTHGATLLHYVGANGIEGFRQKTPKNAAAIATLLLQHGAAVDSVAPIYGGSTTLGLVATSIHPMLAGVQDELIALLLEHGASMRSESAPDDRNSAAAPSASAASDTRASEIAAADTAIGIETDTVTEAEIAVAAAVTTGAPASASTDDVTASNAASDSDRINSGSRTATATSNSGTSSDSHNASNSSTSTSSTNSTSSAGTATTTADSSDSRTPRAHGRIVNDCLANGRPGAAMLLAARGAPLDLEAAAGVGRLDIVQQFFDAAGQLTAGATRTQLIDGFAWACEYGRTAVAHFLLDRGVPIDGPLRHHGQTGLHWAAYGGHADTVALLLRRHAPVDRQDAAYGGTALDWALYGWTNQAGDAAGPDYHDVVAQLVAAGARLDPGWYATDPDRQAARDKVRGDARMRAALAPTGVHL